MANPGKGASPTGRAEVVRRSAVGAGGSGLACGTFLLGQKEGLSEDSEDSMLRQGDLQAFLESFSLP